LTPIFALAASVGQFFRPRKYNSFMNVDEMRVAGFG